jgi:hypothetical protein
MAGARTRPLLAALLVCLPLTVAAAGCSFTENNNNGNCDAVGASNSANCPGSEDSTGGLAAPPTASAAASPSDPGPGEEATSTGAPAVDQGYTPPANASVAPVAVASSGPGWYLYTGDGNPDPVHLTGTPAYPRWATSPVPAEIHITPATVDGTNDNYGTIMVGEGQIPEPYGSTEGEDYPDWWWDDQGIQLSWANLNNKSTVIEDVIVQTTGYLRTLRGASGAYAPTCLSFVFPSSDTPQAIQLNSANNWVPVAACE